jgi:hypothetical protein
MLWKELRKLLFIIAWLLYAYKNPTDDPLNASDVGQRRSSRQLRPHYLVVSQTYGAGSGKFPSKLRKVLAIDNLLHRRIASPQVAFAAMSACPLLNLEALLFRQEVFKFDSVVVVEEIAMFFSRSERHKTILLVSMLVSYHKSPFQ